MKKKKRIVKIISLVLVAGLIGFFVWSSKRPAPEMVSYHRTTPVMTMDLRNTVDVTGNIESEDSVGVYSAVSQEVIEIAVEVGDRVEEGDFLCRMDTSLIQSEMTAKQAAMAKAQQSSQMAVNQANSDLYYAQWYLENEKNSDILSAQQAVESAERALEEVRFSIRSAEDNLDSARKQNRDAKDDGDDAIYSNSDMNRLRDQVSSAYLQQESAEANLEAARQRLERANWDAKQNLKKMEDALASAKNNSNMTPDYIALDKLREDLDNCVVTAPTSGMVTAVYTSVGADSKGLMFMIENTEELIVETTIKEYDVNIVKPGMKVQIKSEATGEEIFEGEVISIDPASKKNAAGETITGSTAEYGAKVKVLSRDHGLRIGMNVRLNIVVEEKNQVLSVPYDCVGEDEEGFYVYVARPEENGDYVARRISVTPGMETDLYLEVASSELAEGDLILQDIMMVEDGMPVNLPEEDPAMMGMMG